MRAPIGVRYRNARYMLKFTGHHGPRAVWFVICQTIKGGY